MICFQGKEPLNLTEDGLEQRWDQTGADNSGFGKATASLSQDSGLKGGVGHLFTQKTPDVQTDWVVDVGCEEDV